MRKQNETIDKIFKTHLEIIQAIHLNYELISMIEAVGQLCFDRIRKGNKLLFMGNGGSAAEADHIAAEFVGRFLRERSPMNAISLTSNASIISAVSNDYAFEEVFKRQIKAIGNEGDIAFGYTTSGNSMNIINGLKEAKTLGIVTVALCGENDRNLKFTDYLIRVPSSETPRIQEAHTLIGHIICQLVETKLISN